MFRSKRPKFQSPTPNPRIRRSSIPTSEHQSVLGPAATSSIVSQETEANEIAKKSVANQMPAKPFCACGGGCPKCAHVSPPVANTGRDTHAGMPLPQNLKTYFEARLQHPLDQVRIHGGSEATEAANAENAKAFTQGNDISFAPGRFQPHSLAGKRLLAHELVHVRQQAQAGRAWVQREQAETRPRRTADTARTAAEAALDQAINRLNEAIQRTGRGEEMPEDVRAALAQFFPGEDQTFLPLLLERITAIRGLVPRVRIRPVFRPVDASIDPDGADINAMLRARRIPISPLPVSSTPSYLVVFRHFYREADLAATRLIHECFHLYFPSFIRHSETNRGHEAPRANAFAYQGFVSRLGGLRMIRPLELFPAPEGEQPPAPAGQPVEHPVERPAEP